MKMNKLLAIALVLLMVMSMLAGCGAASKDAAMNSAAMDVPAAEEYYAEDVFFDDTTIEKSELSSTDNTGTALPENQKIITTLYMEAETENMDPLLEQINKKIEELGGYMEAQEIYNGSSYNSYRYRYANLTVRIPAEKMNSFVAHVNENANIVSKNITTENVTLSYVATESRIKALETEQTRLLELLAKAENMEDLLMIESRLTEVRTELEQVNSVLRSLDNRINYCTIHLDISEVKEYTEVEEPETVWDRIATGFTKSMENVGEGIVDFFVFIIVAFPYFLPFIVIAIVIVVIILLVKRKKAKKQKRQEQNDQPQ